MLVDEILGDLKAKSLMLVGVEGSGKTVMARWVVDHLVKQGFHVTVFDSSTAWWHNAPLPYKLRGYPEPPKLDLSGVVVDIGLIPLEDRYKALSAYVGTEYRERYEEFLRNPDAEDCNPWRIHLIEEAQVNLGRGAKSTLLEWISQGRNIKMRGIYTTQRLAEVSTTIVERCSLLVGAMDGDNNLRKLKNATSVEFKDTVMDLGKWEFAYWSNGFKGKIRSPPVEYASPVENRSWFHTPLGYHDASVSPVDDIGFDRKAPNSVLSVLSRWLNRNS